MNIDQRALGNGTVGHDNDSPMYNILHNSTSTRSEVRCCKKNNPPSSIVVDGIDKESKSSDYLENEYDVIQNVKTTGSDNVGGDEAVKHQDDKLTLRFREKSNGDTAGEKTMNCKQPTEKQLGASVSEIVDNIKRLEKAVLPVCRIKSRYGPRWLLVMRLI